MWMIRFIQYPRNSVENLNRALYIKLLKIRSWVVAKKSPLPPRGEGKWFLRKPHGMKIYKNLNFTFILFLCSYYFFNGFFVCSFFVLLFFSNRNTRRHPEPRIPPDSRSVQILYRISGMLNESNHSHIGDGTFQELTTMVQMGIVKCQANFLWMTKL